MKLKVIKGNNYRDFVQILDVTTKEDFELYEVIKQTLSRKEFNPFVGTFNKTISYSYLFQEYVFPLQFLQDVYQKLSAISSKTIDIIDLDLMFDDTISRETFDEYVETLDIDGIDTQSEEYKFQRDSAFLALKYHLGRIEVATSGGKTFITYLFIKCLIHFNLLNTDEQGNYQKVLVIVPTQLLAKQLKKDFGEFNQKIERPLSVETIYSGAKKIYGADVVCGTFQSLCEYEQEYFDDFGAVICDELHRAKSYSIRNGIYSKMLYSKYYFGMTGTEPEYNTLEYLHIVSMFGPKLIEVDAFELIESGVANPVDVEQILIEYDEYCNYSRELIKAEIKGTEKYNLEKEFFHNYEPRHKLLGKLLNHYTDNSLILTNTVEFCYILYDFLTEFCTDIHFEVVHGIHPIYKMVKERDDIIQEMRDTPSNYCIIGTAQTMSTGISINTLTNGYIVDGGKAKTNMGQSIGRLMRLLRNNNGINVKKRSKFFDFQDMMMGSSFKDHTKERNKYYIKKKFPITTTRVKI